MSNTREPIVPMWWWDALRGSERYRFNAIGVAMLICKHRNYKTNGLEEWHQETIGQHLGLNRKRVSEALALLEQAGIVSIRRHARKAATYLIHLSLDDETATGTPSGNHDETAAGHDDETAAGRYDVPVAGTHLTPSTTPSFLHQLASSAKKKRDNVGPEPSDEMIKLVAPYYEGGNLVRARDGLRSALLAVGAPNAARLYAAIRSAVADGRRSPVGAAVAAVRANYDAQNSRDARTVYPVLNSESHYVDRTDEMRRRVAEEDGEVMTRTLDVRGKLGP